jgi:uncharacterized coiled-coil protein SlyX
VHEIVLDVDCVRDWGAINMEPRIAALEAQIEYIKGRLDSLFTSVEATRQDIGKLREDVATLKERVAHLPRKEFIVIAVLASLAVAAAVIAFRHQIERFVDMHL